MFLLDTNVISEMRKIDSGRADSHVSTWIDEQDASDLYVSVVTLAELDYGIRLKQRRDPNQSLFLRRWFNHSVLPFFEDRIVTIDFQIAMKYSEINVPNHLPDRDSWIAATALVHTFVVVTRNTKDFEASGVALYNPWTFQDN